MRTYERLLLTGIFLFVLGLGDALAFYYGDCSGTPAKWGSNTVHMRASKVSFPPNEFGATALLNAAARWNQNPSSLRFNLTLNDEGVAVDNGQSEIWGQAESSEYISGASAVTLLVWEDCSEIVEADIVVNADLEWFDGQDGVAQDVLTIYGASPRHRYFRAVVLHEMGHSLGVYHEERFYNLMGMATSHVHTNCGATRASPGEDASTGAVFLYGAGPNPAQDLGVTHWKWVGTSALFPELGTDEYSIHGRTEIFDLAGNPLPTVPTPPVEERPWDAFQNVTYLVHNGASLRVEFTYENNGSDTQLGIPVTFVLSQNDCITMADRVIGSTNLILSRDIPFTLQWSLTLPSDLIEGANYSIGGIIDSPGAVAEFDETNNASPIDIQILTAVPISLRLDPAGVDWGGASTGTVILSGAAPPGGAVVLLNSSRPAVASVPASVTVPQGADRANFPVSVSSGGGVICPPWRSEISATRAGTTVTAIITITADWPTEDLWCGPEKPTPDWASFFENAYICLDFSGGYPGLPRGSGAPPGNRCPPPESCPDCVFSLAGRPVHMPPYLSKLRPRVLALVHNVGMPRPSTQWIEELRTLFMSRPQGQFYDQTLRTRVLQGLDSFERTGRLTAEVAGSLVAALHAIELDLRMPDLKPQRVEAGQWSRADIAGVASVSVSNARESGTISLEIQAGIPAKLTGFAPGWPVITHLFRYTGELAEGGFFEVGLNIQGINFANDPLTLRVFQWDGKRYLDVTRNLDLLSRVIYARTETLSTLVLLNENPSAIPTEARSQSMFDWLRRLLGRGW